MRNLGANRIYLHRPAAIGVMLIEIEGAVDEEKFREALAKALSHHEQLSSKIALDADWEAGYVPCAEPVVTLEVETYEPAESDDEESLTDIAIEWVPEITATRFDLANGEFLKHILITDGEETVWGIASHYLAGDAYSIEFFAEDVLRLLDGESLGEPIPYQPIDEKMPDHSDLALPARARLQNINKRWLRDPKRFDADDFERMHQNFHEAYPLRIATAKLGEETVTKLQSISEEKQIRFTALLAAALAMASGDKEGLSVSVSTRPEGYRGVGVYVGSAKLPMPKKLYPEFWDLAQEFSKILDDTLPDASQLFHTEKIAGDLDGTLLDAGYYARYDAFKQKEALEMAHVYSIQQPGTGTQLLNTKVAPIQTIYGFGQITGIYLFGPTAPSYARVVGVATVGKNLTLTSGFYSKEIIETTIPAKAAEILREIEA